MLNPGEAAVLILSRSWEGDDYKVAVVRAVVPELKPDQVELGPFQVPVQELQDIRDIKIALEYGRKSLETFALAG
jgi:hypothetical protein